ncbi:MFS transporter [Paroceanicella profunda]|uniref:MFS transporter n=1 Tax=Paroceanicella profunda TaxID=2579971 RepID=A0A5B8FIJ5_9RHOB|nr:MFS transporter [Paroceanicella profunda]QDL93327.1 MFS transporter [Paroceanicella profunda]
MLPALSPEARVPDANALAPALMPARRRGAALSIATGGRTLALVFGVPLGAIAGNRFGWRMTCGGVALATVATLGLLAGLPRDSGRDMAVVTRRDWIAVVVRPDILPAWRVMMLRTVGIFTICTCLAPCLTAAISMARSATCCPVETGAHVMVLPGGAPAETIIDYVGRGAADSCREHVAPCGDERSIPEMPALRISAPRQMPKRIRARTDALAARAPDLAGAVSLPKVRMSPHAV